MTPGAQALSKKKDLTAQVCEIFSSIQGEGIHVGERHLFIRLSGCDLDCVYCDERGKPSREMTVPDILGVLRNTEAERGPHAYVSITGGEPLLSQGFLRVLVPQIRRAGFRVYLETNGAMPDAIEPLLPWLDVIAMDMKPRSVTRSRGLLVEHAKFLKKAAGHDTHHPEIFVKITVSETLDLEEFRQHCEVIRRINPGIPLVLQPADGHATSVKPEELAHFLFELQHIALNMLKDVRVIARVHKILNLQ